MSTEDLFRTRLDRIDRPAPSAGRPGPQHAVELDRRGVGAGARARMVAGANLFGPTVMVAGAGVSAAGLPRLPVRLMVSLPHLEACLQRERRVAYRALEAWAWRRSSLQPHRW